MYGGAPAKDFHLINFLILGAQKAATSALHAALRAQLEIAMPAGESAFFEDPDFASRPWESFTGEHRNTVLRGIKRPDYLCSEQAIERIAATLPDARFIAVLREPVSRAVSSYLYMVRHAHLPALGLDEGMERCIASWREGRPDRAATVISYGLYGQFVARWYEHYPRERFLFLPQTFVSQNPGGTLAACRHHLGLPEIAVASIEKQEIGRANEGLYDTRLLPLARLASLVQTRRIPGTLRREPRVLPLRAAGALMSRGVEALARWRGQERPTLPTQMRAKLEEIYDADRELLRNMVSSDALYWDGPSI